MRDQGQREEDSCSLPLVIFFKEQLNASGQEAGKHRQVSWGEGAAAHVVLHRIQDNLVWPWTVFDEYP